MNIINIKTPYAYLLNESLTFGEKLCPSNICHLVTLCEARRNIDPTQYYNMYVQTCSLFDIHLLLLLLLKIVSHVYLFLYPS